MPIGPAPVAVAAADRWLLAFSLATLAVLAVGSFARRVARTGAARARRGEARSTPGVRRRAGVVVALAVLGAWAERHRDPDRFAAVMIIVAAAIAVVGGVRFGPTGVGVLDALGALVVIALATAAVDGLGAADGLAPSLGAAGALG